MLSKWKMLGIALDIGCDSIKNEWCYTVSIVNFLSHFALDIKYNFKMTECYVNVRCWVSSLILYVIVSKMKYVTLSVTLLLNPILSHFGLAILSFNMMSNARRHDCETLWLQDFVIARHCDCETLRLREVIIARCHDCETLLDVVISIACNVSPYVFH